VRKSLKAAMTKALQNINTPLRRKHPNVSGKAKLQLPVNIEMEVHDLATIGSEPEVVEHNSCAKDSDNDKDEASKRTLYKLSISSLVSCYLRVLYRTCV
jgi:hypothetical protein